MTSRLLKFASTFALLLSSAACSRELGSALSDATGMCPFSQRDTIEEALDLCGAINPSNIVVTNCLTTVSALLKTAPSSCIERYHAQLQLVPHQILLSQIHALPSTVKAADLRPVLQSLASWYNDIAPKVFADFVSRTSPPPSEDVLSFQSRLDLVASTLWSQLNTKLSNLDNVTFDPMSANTLSAPAKLFDALADLPTDMQFPGELYAAFLSDTLMPLNIRVQTFAQIHDLVCELELCADPSEAIRGIRSLVRIMAAVGNSAAFNDLLGNAVYIPQPILNFLRSVGKSQHLLTSALASPQTAAAQQLPGLGANYLELIGSVDLNSAPRHLRRLLANVQTYRHMVSNQKITLKFFGQETHTLDFGLDTATLERIKSLNSNIASDLQNSTDSYAIEQNHLIDLAYQHASLATEAKVAQFPGQQNALLLSELLSDLAGTRQALAATMARIAKQQQQAEETVSSAGVRYFEAQSVNGGTKRFGVKGSDARFSPNGAQSSDLSLMSFKKLTAGQDEYFRMQTTGDFSPVCALKKTYPATVLTPLPRVGPEGFEFVTRSGGVTIDSVSNSKTESHYEAQGVSVQACGGASTGSAVPGPTASVQICAEASFGHRKDTSTSTGDLQQKQLSTEASFRAGLRLSDTPFPDMPAGSILAVTVPSGKTQILSVTNVQVIDRNTLVMPQANSDIYLLVNDCDSETDSTNSLTMEVLLFRSMQGASRKLIATMTEQLQKFESRAGELLGQKGTTAEALANLRAEIALEVTQASDGGLDFAESPALRDLFRYWLDNQALVIQQKAAIIDLQRKLDSLAITLQSQEASEAGLASRQRIEQLQIDNTLNNADIIILTRPLNRAVAYLSNRVLPMMRFQFPNLIPRIEGGKELAQNLRLDATILEVAKKLVTLTSNVNFSLKEEDSLRAATGQTASLMLRFPDPKTTVTTGIIPTADINRSLSLWTSLLAETPLSPSAKVTLDLDEQDFYRPELVSAALPCSAGRPVVKSMMLAIAMNKAMVDQVVLDQLNQGLSRIGLDMGPNMRFATDGGPMAFRLADQALSSSQLPVGFVPADAPTKAWNLMTSREDAAAAGLGFSPFTQLSLSNYAGLRNYIQTNCPFCVKAITAFYVVMKVNVQSINSPRPLDWLSQCRASPAAG